MQTLPAFHIAVLGVYPNREIIPSLRESFIAAQSKTTLETINAGYAARLWAHARQPNAASVEMEMAQEEQSQEYMEAVSHTLTVARERMQHAYILAGRSQWIKPIIGAVIVGDPVNPDCLATPRGQLLSNARKIFHEFADGSNRGGFFKISGQPAEGKPLAQLGHIRCVVEGKIVPFTDDNEEVLLKSIEAPFLEPQLRLLNFDINSIDTVAACAALPAYQKGPEMGFAPAPKSP